MGLETFHYFVISATKDDLPFPPFVHLHLKMWSHREGKGSDLPLLTAQLTTDTEIDYWVDFLKRDLDRAGRRAKAALKRASAKSAVRGVGRRIKAYQ